MAKITLSDIADARSPSAATTTNYNNAALETALENTLSRDGTTPNQMEADLDMNSNRILNLPEAVNNTEPLRKAEFDELVTSLLVSGQVTLSGDSGVVIADDDGVIASLTGTGGQVLVEQSGTTVPAWQDIDTVLSANAADSRTALGLDGWELKTPPTGDVVGTTDTQTLTNKNYIAANLFGTTTINDSTVTIPNGLNFDGNTLIIDAVTNRIGIGRGTTPDAPIHVGANAVSSPNSGIAIARAVNEPDSSHGFSVGDTVTVSTNFASNAFDDRSSTTGDYTLTPNGQAHRYCFQTSGGFAHSGYLPTFSAFYSQWNFGTGGGGSVANYNGFHFSGPNDARITQNGTISTTLTTITGLTDTSSIKVGYYVGGTNIPFGRQVTAVNNSTTVTLNGVCSADATVSVTFSPVATNCGLRVEDQVGGIVNRGMIIKGDALENDIYGVLNLLGTTDTTGATSGVLRVSGGTYLAKTLRVAGNTASTTTTNGTVIVTGGVGISGGLNMGGSLNVTGSINGSNNIIAIGTSSLVGYGTGAGASATQSTNKSTAVTLNRSCGKITMSSSLLAPNTTVSFTVNNNNVNPTDVILINQSSGGTAGAYNLHVTTVGSGSFVISVTNITAGNLSEAIAINFAVIKAVIL